MSFIYLLFAILFEVAGTSLLKVTHNPFSVKTFFMLISYGFSLFLLSLALKKIDIGIAYAIWSGLGITAIELMGIIFFKESINATKLIFITFIIIGTIGLNYVRS